MENKINPPFKYNGKKYVLMEQLNDLFPSDVDIFYDLFGGSGVVSLNCKYDSVIYNDINEHTTTVLNYLLNNDTRIINKDLEKIFQEYKLENKEHFNNFRKAYNINPTPDKFLVLLQISFNNIMRFNQKGEYNSTYGERNFTLKHYNEIVEFVNANKNKKIIIYNLNYNQLIKKITKNDFVYCDPPYNITHAGYNHFRNETDEKMLYDNLDYLNNKGIRFALSNVLEHNGKTNTILKEWLDKNNYNVYKLKNNKRKELLITNYEKEQNE
jgi:DNA adenine methylase Dam|nr:MAG TPA: adenine-specific methyltransferase [Caudoviricetes sp.]